MKYFSFTYKPLRLRVILHNQLALKWQTWKKFAESVRLTSIVLISSENRNHKQEERWLSGFRSAELDEMAENFMRVLQRRNSPTIP